MPTEKPWEGYVIEYMPACMCVTAVYRNWPQNHVMKMIYGPVLAYAELCNTDLRPDDWQSNGFWETDL